MESGDNDTSTLANMTEITATPGFAQSFQTVQQIVGFDVQKRHQAVFTRFHGFITQPQPDYVTAWRANPSLGKWYSLHVNGVLGDVRGALAAAHYHQVNLARLEHELFAALKAIELVDQLDNSTVAFGGTRKLDFEYQAFVLACRRALDYLAGSLSAFFKTESNSFRSLPKAINARKPSAVSKAIKDAHARHVGDLNYIMAEGRRSIRNRIAHYEFVSAGTLNISSRGLMLVGGGEQMNLDNADREVRLQDFLENKLVRLHTCVDDMIDSFMTAVGGLSSGHNRIAEM